MRKNIIIFICICLNTLLYAQTDKMPQTFSYQAIVHDTDGKVLADKAIGIKVDILKNTAEGSCIYSEKHSATSSAAGTVTLLIGQGTQTSGNFSSIDWGADTYYLQLNMDIQGGTDYKKISVAPILPVPLTLYAAKAGSVENGGVGESYEGKFSIMPIGNDTNIHEILSGEDIDSDGVYLDCYITYLDGKDQNIDIVVEGLPQGVTIDNSDGEFGVGDSTPEGRFIQLYYWTFPKGEHIMNLVFKGNDGKGLKKYPFKLIIK